jgi:hypothetical protein
MNETLVSHRGGIGISGGYMSVLRERGIGLAMAYNTVGQPVIPIGQGVLAIACGDDPEDAVPLLRVIDAIEGVTGDYTSYRDAMTVTVEKGPASTIRLVFENQDMTFTATPEDTTGDEYTFSQTMGDSTKWTAEFQAAGSQIDLILSRQKWTSRLVKE